MASPNVSSGVASAKWATACRGREGRGHRDQRPDPVQRFTPGRIGPKYETSAVLLLAVDPGERLLRRLQDDPRDGHEVQREPVGLPLRQRRAKNVFTSAALLVFSGTIAHVRGASRIPRCRRRCRSRLAIRRWRSLLLNVRPVDRLARGAEQWSRAASTRRKKWESTWVLRHIRVFAGSVDAASIAFTPPQEADAGVATPGYGRVPLSPPSRSRREWLPIYVPRRAPSG